MERNHFRSFSGGAVGLGISNHCSASGAAVPQGHCCMFAFVIFVCSFFVLCFCFVGGVGSQYAENFMYHWTSIRVLYGDIYSSSVMALVSD